MMKPKIMIALVALLINGTTIMAQEKSSRLLAVTSLGNLPPNLQN